MKKLANIEIEFELPVFFPKVKNNRLGIDALEGEVNEVIYTLKPGEKIDFEGLAREIFQQHVEDGACKQDDIQLYNEILANIISYVQVLERDSHGNSKVTITITGDYPINGSISFIKVPGTEVGLAHITPKEFEDFLDEHVIFDEVLYEEQAVGFTDVIANNHEESPAFTYFLLSVFLVYSLVVIYKGKASKNKPRVRRASVPRVRQEFEEPNIIANEKSNEVIEEERAIIKKQVDTEERWRMGVFFTRPMKNYIDTYRAIEKGKTSGTGYFTLKEFTDDQGDAYEQDFYNPDLSITDNLDYEKRTDLLETRRKFS